MNRILVSLTALLVGFALFGCAAKKTGDDSSTKLLGMHLDFNAVPSSRSTGGKVLDIDASVTVLNTEFGFVTSANGTYIKGVKGMDPNTRKLDVGQDVYDPEADPAPQAQAPTGQAQPPTGQAQADPALPATGPAQADAAPAKTLAVKAP